MNILWVTKLSDANPFKSTQFGMTDALRKKGHRVDLYLVNPIDHKKPSSNTTKYLPVIDRPFLSGFIFGFYLLFFFPYIVKKEHIDVVLVDGDQIFSPFALILRIMKVLLVWDIRSLPIDKDRSILHDISFFMTNMCADVLTTITPELKEILIHKFHLQHKQIGLWTSGVSLEIFSSRQCEPIPFFDTNKFLIMYHGTYSPTRGIEELITSITYIDKDIRENIKLVIIGIEHAQQNQLTSLVSELGITQHIDILPPVQLNKIPCYIKHADIGVIPLPPNNEWWRVSVPLKTLEYLIMEKPVIVTDIPFHKKLMQQCSCGIMIPTGKPSEIANAISNLFHRQDQIPTMGKHGKHFVESHYTWDHIASELESFIKQVMVK